NVDRLLEAFVLPLVGEVDAGGVEQNVEFVEFIEEFTNARFVSHIEFDGLDTQSFGCFESVSFKSDGVYFCTEFCQVNGRCGSNSGSSSRNDYCLAFE